MLRLCQWYKTVTFDTDELRLATCKLSFASFLLVLQSRCNKTVYQFPPLSFGEYLLLKLFCLDLEFAVAVCAFVPCESRFSILMLAFVTARCNVLLLL